MPYVSPGSSALTIAPPSPPVQAVIDKLAELSVDEPLPETYSTNRIRLIAQSPLKLYLYWEFARNPFETLRRAFSTKAETYTLVVKLIDLQSEHETLYQALPTRSHWLDAQQGRSYRTDVGFYAPGRAFIRLLSSTAIRTPRAGVSTATDPTPEFRVSPDEFARVLDDAGYLSDALEVSLEAADGATHDAATRAIAQRFGGMKVPSMKVEELKELRGLIVALALGANVMEVQAALSTRLARWLEQASRERPEMMDAVHLLEILRAVLGIEMNSTTFGILNEEAMRRSARISISASAVNLPLKPFHLWMPSMSRSFLERVRAEG